jgi:SnoaL-like protein
MELWELVARESIRDLVARYNANGDSGRLSAAVEVFTADARFDLIEDNQTRHCEGVEEIAGLLGDFKTKWMAEAEERNSVPFVRHFVSTHVIDVQDREHARGRCYIAVVMAHGLDHWGRYIDDYVLRDGRWLIAHRKAITDGRAARPGL